MGLISIGELVRRVESGKPLLHSGNLRDSIQRDRGQLPLPIIPKSLIICGPKTSLHEPVAQLG